MPANETHVWDDGGAADFEYPANEPSSGEVSSGTINRHSDELRQLAKDGLKLEGARFVDTEMAKMVKEWRETIRPQLEAEDTLPDFNIREYINLIDTQMLSHAPDRPRQWSEFVENRPQHERSRVFVSMLQMANEGKLTIVQPPEEDQGTSRAIGAFRLVPITDGRERVAGDDVQTTREKRFRAPSSPTSSQTPAPKRKMAK